MTDQKDLRIITPMSPAMVDRIDDYRFSNRLPSRSEAIRQLIEFALHWKTLEAAKGAQKEKA
jgi:Arc/MetJ-type ribon-helix-helix transcriptional regulator